RGLRFDLSLLATVTGASEDEVVEELERAVEERLIADEGQTYVFTHPAVRQVFLGQPSRTRRERMHLQIADRFAEQSGNNPDGALWHIAHHLVRAGRAADPARVRDYARGQPSRPSPASPGRRRQSPSRQSSLPVGRSSWRRRNRPTYTPWPDAPTTRPQIRAPASSTSRRRSRAIERREMPSASRLP